MKDRACGTHGKEAKSLSTKYLCENPKELYLMQGLQNDDIYLKQNGSYSPRSAYASITCFC
jgi:hypothetical protein